MLEFGPFVISIWSKIFIPISSIDISPIPLLKGILLINAFILFVVYGDLDPNPLIIILLVFKLAEWTNIPGISFKLLPINSPSNFFNSKLLIVEIKNILKNLV